MAATSIDPIVAERLLNCDWLANCGVIGQEPPGVRLEWETDKEEIIRYVNSDKFRYKWQTVCLEEQNEVTEFLFFNHPNEYHGKWNQFVREAKEIITPQIEPVIKQRIEQLGLPQEKLWNNISFNVYGIAVVSYYKEYIRSPFYDTLLDIYCGGHLPFGWRGKSPPYMGWNGKPRRGVIRVY